MCMCDGQVKHITANCFSTQVPLDGRRAYVRVFGRKVHWLSLK